MQSYSVGRSTGFVRSHCGVYPASRFLRVLKQDDPIRLTDPQILVGLTSKQFKVDAENYHLLPLHPREGEVIKPTRAAKNIFVCGLRRNDVHEMQDRLVREGIYPDRLEIGSIASLGTLLHLTNAEEGAPPMLVLEIGAQSSMVFILSNGTVDAARPISFGLDSMVTVLRQELGLKDDGAARKLFYSDSFDLTEMGPRLIERLLRELQSSVGYYEVQTGQSIGRLFCSLLPNRLSWLTGTFAEALGTSAFDPDMSALLADCKIEPPPDMKEIPVAWLGLIGLMIQFGASASQ